MRSIALTHSYAIHCITEIVYSRAVSSHNHQSHKELRVLLLTCLFRSSVVSAVHLQKCHIWHAQTPKGKGTAAAGLHTMMTTRQKLTVRNETREILSNKLAWIYGPDRVALKGRFCICTSMVQRISQTQSSPMKESFGVYNSTRITVTLAICPWLIGTLKLVIISLDNPTVQGQC